MHLKHIKKFRTILQSALAKTGQMICYYLGDDGYYQKGLPTQGNRFIDNGDGTITDRVTNLMWVKDPSQIPGGLWGTPGSPTNMVWPDAVDNCENLIYAGYSDWRLPNIRELMSIVDYGKYYPAIDTLYFPNTMLDGYWSSTALDPYPENAWMIWMYEGWQGADWIDPTGYPYYVRPVRGGV